MASTRLCSDLVVTRLALWTASACESYAERVFAHRPDWIPRHHELPSYTLGAAAYLDVPQVGLSAYALRARRMNALLGADFDPAYRRLEEVLSAYLGAPVERTRRWGLPGFHLFLHHPRLHTLTPSLHFDLQYRKLRWPEAEVSPREDRRSFTVLLRGPKNGAGLKLWSLRLDQVEDLPLEEIRALSVAEPPERHRYQVGELFVHDGDHLHQIDEELALGEGEARVTLQGHAQKTKDRWILYW